MSVAPRRWLSSVGNLGLLLVGIAALIAAAKFAGLVPTLNRQGGQDGSLREIAAGFAPAVSWVLVIIGWLFVSHDQNRRERRKEVRGEVEDLVEQIREIELRAYDYLPTTGTSKDGRSLENRLRSDLQRLALGIARLAQFEKLDVMDEMGKLRQAVTSREFDSRTRQARNLDSEWAIEIRTAANSLADALQSAFRQGHQ